MRMHHQALRRPTGLLARLFVRLFASLIMSALLTPMALAETGRNTGQYESQYRIVNPNAAQSNQTNTIQPADPGSDAAEAQIRQLENNPYAQALLLQQLGQTAISEQNYTVALDYLERMLALNQLSEVVTEPVRAQLPNLYAATNQYKKFITAYEAKARTETGLTATEWLQLGNAYLQTKKLSKALRPIEQALAKNPEAPEDWYRLRLAVLQQLGRKKAMIKALQEMLPKFAGQPEYWLQLAQLQAEQKQWRAAVSTLDLAYRQSLLESANELQLYARLTNRAGWPHRAGALTQTWIEQNLIGNNADNWQEVAGYWLAANEHGRAIQALQTATELSPNASLYLQLGQLHVDVGQWAAAAAALQTALATGQVRASLGRANMLLGMSYYQLARYPQALQAFNQAQQQADTEQAATQWLNFISQLATANIAPAELGGALRAAAEQGELAWASEELTQRLARPASQQNTAAGNAGSLALPTALANNPDQQYIEPKLGRLLTPIGATQAGNQAGTIPAWRGGITPDKTPTGFTKGDRPVNPFADEKPLFVITGQNVDQYAQQLSEGHIALLKKYPSYQIPVYPSHRTAAYPQAVYDATASNVRTAKLIGTESIQNAKLGFPFPRPNTGAEVLWNHKMRFRGTTRVSINASALVEDGKPQIRVGKQQVYFAYGNLTEPVSTDESNRLVYGLFQLGSGRRTEGLALVHEPADHNRQQRKIWVGGSGSRGRLITVPFVSYDFPISDGGMFIDQIDMYNGAFDYYSWKLVGKQEMIIPYNAYDTLNPDKRYKDLLQADHYHPDNTRYELHRVWIVDAQLRAGESHKLPQRRFYIDEDSWTVVMADNYDDQGRLHKFQEAHPLTFYGQPFVEFTTMLVYDFLKGDYLAAGMANEAKQFWEIDQGGLDAGSFTPNAARRLIQ